MKKFLFVLLLVIGSVIGYGQSGFYEGRYYTQQYSIQDVCGPTYSVFQGYDYYGRPIYFYFQNCQRARWFSYSGYQTGYYWVWNGYNYVWQSRYEYRTWWYYDWINYSRRVY